jgi:osmoprotectant transport system substrate-binding protein
VKRLFINLRLMACIAALAGAISGCGSASSNSSSANLGPNGPVPAKSTGAASPTPPRLTASTASTASTPTTTQPLPGTGKPPIVIGDKNFTEQFLLGELYYLALTAQGYDVSLTQNIGSTSVSLQAIAAHTLDMYPEYLNVILTGLAGEQGAFKHLRSAFGAAQSWSHAHGLTLLPATPFSDTAGLGVTTAYATHHRLAALGGLWRVESSLTVGAPPEFQSGPYGMPALEQAYGFFPAKVQTVNVGAQYAALSAGDVQAAYVNTTDGQLSGHAYTILRDPRRAFGYGNVVPVVSSAVLAAEGPVFARTIERVDRLLHTAVIRQLNAEVDLDLESPTLVAKRFLEQHGVIPPGS